MFDHFLRALKDRLLAPLARLVGRRVHPDVVSVVACLVGLGAAWAAWRRRDGLALALWLGNRTLDGFDGTLARETGRQTDFGGYLDIVLDFLVYAAIPVGLVLGRPTPANVTAGLLLLAAFFVNAPSWMYLSAVLERRGYGAAATGERTTVTMPPGLVAGAETVVLFSLFLAMPSRAALVFGVMAALVLATVVQRLAWARRALQTVASGGAGGGGGR